MDPDDLQGGRADTGPAGNIPAVRRVREAGERLAAVEGTPAAAHVATYDEVHAVLQDALADLDEH